MRGLPSLRAAALPLLGLGLALLVAHAPHPARAAANTAKDPCPVTDQYDANKDYFGYKVTPQYSRYWSVKYSNNYKVLTNTLTNDTYVLYLCNTPFPSTSTPNARLFQIPSFLVGTGSRTATRFIERLGLRERTRYVPSAGLLTSPCLQTLVEQGFTQSIPQNWTGKDVDVWYSKGPHAAPETVAVNETNLATSVMLSSLWEGTPLARLEWIKFISAFFNLEGVANDVFQKALSSYTCSNTSADAAAQKAGKRPVVAWMGRVNGSATAFQTEEAEWKGHAIVDAGGSPITLGRVTESTALAAQLATVDVLIDDTPGLDTLAQIQSAYGLGTGTFPFLTAGAVYKPDRRKNAAGINDFEQSYWAMPDYIQHDLIHILYPSLHPDWKPMWFRNIAKGETVETVTSAQCPNSDTSSPFAASYQSPPSLCSSSGSGGLSPAAIGGIAGGGAGTILLAAGGYAAYKYRRDGTVFGVSLKRGGTYLRFKAGPQGKKSWRAHIKAPEPGELDMMGLRDAGRQSEEQALRNDGLDPE